MIGRPLLQRSNKIIQVFGLFLFLLLHSMTRAANLLAIEVKSSIAQPSVEFILDEVTSYKIFTLTNPNRMIIDLNHTRFTTALHPMHLNKALIKGIRYGYFNPQTLRVVLDLNQAVTARTHHMQAQALAKQVLSLKLFPQANTTNKSVALSSRSMSDPLRKPIIPRHAPGRSLRDVIVVIDPGHGGKDPGASGPRGTQEKNITLAIASKLKQRIDKQIGMRAILTRSSDYYIELRGRLNSARRYNADIFVSIHADAFINPESNGASIFALSPSGATSEAARWLAAKENYSELGGVNLSELDDQSGLVRTVLIDLSQTATIDSSLRMGDRVLRRLIGVTRLHNHKVEQARFMVLKSPDIPSILVETGFISNVREERNLTSSNYQNDLTQAIFQGIKNYFWDYPPHGTRIEALVENHIHWVRRGESLPSIATKYHISLAALQSANHLVSQPLKVGQKLLIPSSLI